MGKWLFYILKDNTLVDNQVYRADDGVFTNHRLIESVHLDSLQKGCHNKPWNDEKKIWNFLNTTGRAINRVLLEKRDKAVVLFNDKEYEHNSDDDFIQIAGIDCRNFNLTTGNLIGYIRDGDYDLKISSRFGDAFLKEIIADADGFVEIEEYGGDKNDNGYEWLLIYLWKIKLKKAYRLGLPKVYKSHNEVLTKVRGTIDPVNYYINRNQGKYRCNYREHSYNIPAVRLITEAIQKVKGHSFSHDLHTIKQAFITATNGERLKLSELKSINYFTNPFYADYNPVIDLSKMILRDEFSNFGNNSDANAFLFDISMLFEYFIRKIFIRNGFPLQRKFGERKVIHTCALDGYKRKIEPDIVIESDDGVSVFDVKYKAYDFSHGVKREDIFQLHTYIGQYGNDATIKQAGFIYPISKEKWKHKTAFNGNTSITQQIEIMGKTVPFTVFFFVVPEKCKAKEYHTHFQDSIVSFVDEFRSTSRSL